MTLERSRLVVRFGTLCALVGSLPGVGVHVGVQVPELAEPLPAPLHLAGVGLLARVGQHVSLQVRPTRKSGEERGL